MILATIRQFARMIGVSDENAEEALRSERSAKAILSRRNLFAAAGAMASGVAFGWPVEESLPPFFGIDRTGGPRYLQGLRVDALALKAAIKSLREYYGPLSDVRRLY